MNDLKSLVAQAIEKIKRSCETYDYEIAETLCRQLLKVDKENSEAWFLLGVCCGCAGKKNDASDAFGEAAELTDIPENKKHALDMQAKLK